MDSTAEDELIRLHAGPSEEGIGPYIARARADVRGFMERDGILEKIGPENIFPKIGDAVEEPYRRRAGGII